MVQKITKAAGNPASMKVKKTGKKAKIFLCTGSGIFGDKAWVAAIDKPISTGHKPTAKKDGGSHGINPNKFVIRRGSGADKSIIHP